VEPGEDNGTDLRQARVEVWYAPLGPAVDGREREQLALLDEEERARLARRRTPAARREFRAAHALLRVALSRRRSVDPRDWRFAAGERGRPELSAPTMPSPLSFNLSHTRDLVACVVAEGVRVGIDVEFAGGGRDVEMLARRVLCAKERADLSACDAASREDRFVDYWTLKEAHLKAIGEGIARPMRAIEVDLIGEADARATLGDEIPDAGLAWHYRRLRPSPVHRLAIAVESDQQVVFRIAELTP
jgi:4'-phosphopantetheinyl transferase